MPDEDFNARLRRKIMGTFEAEARERLQSITDSLLQLENNPPAEEATSLLHDIFREAHTLKGSARGLNLEDVGRIAHKMENIFSRMQTGVLASSPAIFDHVYSALDAIGVMVRAAASDSESGLNVDEICSALEAVAEGQAPPVKQPAAQPSVSASRSSIIRAELLGPNQPSPTPINVVMTESAAQSPPPAAAVAPVTPAAASTPPPPKPPAPPAAASTESETPNLPVPQKPKDSGRSAETMINLHELATAPATALAKDLPAGAATGKTMLMENKPRAPSEETVRVAISKMDALMAQVGEILVTRVSTLRRMNEIGAFLEVFESWEAEWNRTRADCRKILRGPRVVDMQDGHPPKDELHDVPRTLSTFLRNNESRLKSAHAQMNVLRRNFKADSRRMAQVVADLQDEVRRIRMQPIATVFQTFPRMVRDLARELGKEVEFVIKGGDNEMDRSVIEQIGGPLVHLLRNCVDHGLEMPAARVAAGKPGKGQLVLSASQRGGSILIEVSDDGAGIDAAKVKASAVKKGHISAEQAAAMTEREAVWLIFRSGVSTRAAVSDISGRGVGMDVVRESVERLNGIIDVETQVGKGSRFQLSLPLTVATTLSLLVQAGGLTVALPVANVIRIMRIKPDQIGHAGGRAVIYVDGRPLALVSMRDALQINKGRAGAQRPGPSGYLAIIVGSVEERVAFFVDAVVGSQEIMIKSLPKPLLRVPRISGATILGTGEVVIILNAADLTRTSARSSLMFSADAPVEKKKVALVVDDSATIRTLQKNILEAAGFLVKMAGDGLEAWSVLRDGGVDVVISDVNMPRMDGFELTAKIRTDPQFKDLPVVLVTSLNTDADKEKGIRAGADAHIVKNMFEQETLLETINGLI